MFNDLSAVPNPILIGERVVDFNQNKSSKKPDFTKSMSSKKPISAVGLPVPSTSKESPARPRKQPHEPLEPFTIPKRRRNRKDFTDKVKKSQPASSAASCAMEVDNPPPVEEPMDVFLPTVRFNPEPPALLLPELPPPPPPTSPATEVTASLLDLDLDMPPLADLIDLEEPVLDWLLDSDSETESSDDRSKR